MEAGEDPDYLSFTHTVPISHHQIQNARTPAVSYGIEPQSNLGEPTFLRGVPKRAAV